MQASLLEVKAVSLKLNDHLILDHVSFAVHPNQIITIIGPNGAGKTSLIKTLIGLYTPSSGEIIRSKELRVGYMPQKINIDSSIPMTVKSFLKVWGPYRTAEIKKYAELCGILHHLKKQIGDLSGGELQRALLCRALLSQPNLLILDEPTQGVDVIGQADLYALLVDIKNRLGCSMILISHDLHLVMSHTDQVLCLNRHICCHGHPEKVSQHPEYLALFGEQSKDFALYHHHHDHKHGN